MAASLLGLGLLLNAGGAPAQQWTPAPAATPPASQTLYFSKPADTTPPITVPAPAPPPISTVKEAPPPTPAPSKPAPTVKAVAMPLQPPAPPPPPPQPLYFSMDAPPPPPIGSRAPLPSSKYDPLIQRVQGKDAKKEASVKAPGETGEDSFQIQLTPPGPQRLFRLESEPALQERMRQEARQRPQPERIEFPDEPIISRDQYAGRSYPESNLVVEPLYLCYDRLYFEDLNSERYGWDLGFIQPALSVAVFWKDLALLPYHIWSDPCRQYECNAGYCLPGDPVPYLIYPPGLSLTGTVAEALTVIGIVAILP
jgi:hypothetical protein